MSGTPNSVTTRAATVHVVARSHALALVLLLAALIAGCSPSGVGPVAPGATVTEGTSTLSAPDTTRAVVSSRSAEPAGEDVAGRVAVPAESRDLVRDDLPGYVPGPLAESAYALRRTYVPSDKALHDGLTVTVWRYADPAAAQAALKQLTGATAAESATAAGLPGCTYTQGTKRVLVLADGPTVLRLEAHSVSSGQPSALTPVLVDVAETLLD